MYIRFLSDGSDLRTYGGGGQSSSRKEAKSGLFGWSIFITLLIGVTTFVWFFSIMVFQHPEKPFNYNLLARCKKLEPLRPWSPFTVPAGKRLDPTALLSEFLSHSPEQLQARNALLKRAFIQNYRHDKPYYVLGNFKVTGLRLLTSEDVVTQGWVVKARASDLEEVELEIIMPGLGIKDEPFRIGDSFSLESSRPQLAILHVQRGNEDHLTLSTMPLAYSAFAKESQPLGSRKMLPPSQLNMAGQWPLNPQAQGSAEVTEQVSPAPAPAGGVAQSR
jgi:hypothetical protein